MSVIGIIVMWAMLCALALCALLWPLAHHADRRGRPGLLHSALSNLRRLTLSTLLALSAVFTISVAHSGKNMNGGTGTTGILPVATVVNGHATSTGGTPVVPVVVTPEEIAQGWRLESVVTNEAVSYAMPTNGVEYMPWSRGGGYETRFPLDLGDDFGFPFGTGVVRRIDVLSGGMVESLPRQRARCPLSQWESVMSICAAREYASIVPGVGRFWWGDTARSVIAPYQAKLLTWENAFGGRDRTGQYNAQIEFHDDGNFIMRSNNVERVYRRVNPDDWDGDGLANEIDPDPMAYDGDLFGTGVAWLNANCGSVLSASTDANGEIAVSWHTNVCGAAYYWLQFTAQRDSTRIAIDCEGESTLGDLFVVANSNQVCRVPLLMGPNYHVTASHPVADVSASDAEAEVRPVSRGAYGGDFSVKRGVELAVSGGDGSGVLTATPNVGASISSVTGNCCNVSVGGANWNLECVEGCHCLGYYQWWRFIAAWEGYSQRYDWRAQCECQKTREGTPSAWVSLSVPYVVMLGGAGAGASVTYVPPESAHGTVTLRIASGSGKVALWDDAGRTGQFTLPVSWDASLQRELSFFIEGAALSGSVGDVRFEFEIDTGDVSDVVTRRLTVARVKYLHASSDVQGASASPPPFAGESECPFSITNSISPDRHLVVPFYRVVDTNDFSVKDFSVDMALELEPSGIPTEMLPSEWEVVEAFPQMSGSLVEGAGLTAQFLNPKRGGVYRFRGRCGGSPWTEANIVLPLAGAEVRGVFEGDFAIYAQRMAELDATSSRFERQSLSFGLRWFNNAGAADYRGRVDNIDNPTVWRYNQIEDISGFGAVATLYGIPARMAKLGNLLAGYGTKRLGVWSFSRWLSQSIGTDNDATADMSWAAGGDVADGSNLVTTVSALSTNMWHSADIKVKTLWPNPATADNHSVGPVSVDYNWFFRSPRVIEEAVPRP